MTVNETSDARYISLLLEESVLAEIDDFRFENRFESRTAALRWLIRAALDRKLTPKGKKGAN
jgi:hypothetical protein